MLIREDGKGSSIDESTRTATVAGYGMNLVLLCQELVSRYREAKLGV